MLYTAPATEHVMLLLSPELLKVDGENVGRSVVHFHVWPWKIEKTGSADKDSELFTFSSQLAVCYRLLIAFQSSLSNCSGIERPAFSLKSKRLFPSLLYRRTKMRPCGFTVASGIVVEVCKF